MVFQEALLSVPRDHHARPPSPPPPPPSTADNVADAPGDESNTLYSQEWRWANTNARGILTACIAHAVGDLEAMAEFTIPRNATYHTRLGSICVAHIIEDLRDTLDRNGNVSWAHISTPGGYVTAQQQNTHFGFTAAWAMARALALIDRSSPMQPPTSPTPPPMPRATGKHAYTRCTCSFLLLPALSCCLLLFSLQSKLIVLV